MLRWKKTWWVQARVAGGKGEAGTMWGVGMGCGCEGRDTGGGRGARDTPARVVTILRWSYKQKKSLHHHTIYEIPWLRAHKNAYNAGTTERRDFYGNWQIVCLFFVSQF